MAIIKLHGRNKFGNRYVRVDGIRFDSAKEARRYNELRLLERAGEIKNLELQPRFILQKSFKRDGKTHRKIEYVADFRYIEEGKAIVEDVKSSITRKHPVYALKKKLLLKQNPNINFLET
jgi:hypothetical protein